MTYPKSANQNQHPAMPKSIWAIGFVSLFMDISSELIHSLLPMFMLSVLGLSTIVIGAIEGVASAIAMTVKVFSGALSDYWQKRKGLTVLGYGLSAGVKPLFALASSLDWIVSAKFLDRLGKGIRGAPRDALIADITPKSILGAAYGLRKSLDSVGAFVGPLLAIALMALWANDFRVVFWFACIPAVLAMILLIFVVKEPAKTTVNEKRSNPIKRENLKRLSKTYWFVVAIAAMCTLARFSEAFLLLRAEDGGLALHLVPLVFVVMNLVYALSAYPVGKLSDNVSRFGLFAIGMVMLIVADLLLAYSGHWTVLLFALVFWGLHMGFTQGILATMVADSADENLRGTAFGIFNLICGLCLLIASTLAGVLWHYFGASATFIAGAIFCGLSLVLLFGFKNRKNIVQ